MASLQVSPATADFGDVSIGQSAVKTVALSNTGSATITISRLSSSSSAFSIVSAEKFPIDLPAGGNHSISIGFTPVSVIDYSAQLAFVDSTSKPLTQLSVHGRGQNPLPLTAQVLASTTRLDFGSVPINTSTTQTVTLTSAGTSPVTVNSATVSGAGFSLVGGTLPATLSPNQSLTLTVQFSPTAAGSANGQLVVSSNATTGSTTAMALSGSGAATTLPQLTLSTASVSFGNVTVNTSTMQTVTLTSTGTAPVTVNSAAIIGTGFEILGGSLPATLNPNQSTTLQVQFSPTATGSASGQLMINSNSSTGSTAGVALSGTSVAAPSPQLTVSVGSLSFDNVTVNTSTPQTVTLTSTGTAPVTVSAATISGAGFSLLGGNLPTTLNPNQSMTLQVQFSPTAPGSLNGQLMITSNSATGGIATIALSGTGIAVPSPQLTMSASSLSFGSVTVDTSMTQTVTLTSTGTAPVTVSAATISGAGFSLVGAGFPTTLSPNQSLTLQVQFSPAISGSSSGQLTISGNSSTGSTAVVTLSGTGAAVSNPQLMVSTSSANFGNVTLNAVSTQSVTLTSTGNTPVTLSSTTISGAGFTMAAPSFPMKLSPTQSVTLAVQFSPTNTGSTTGQITISSNSASASTVLVTLSGNGIPADPQLTISSASLDFGSVAANTPLTKTLILASTGTSPVVISSATVSGTGFSLVGGSFPLTLNPPQTVTLQLQFLPTGTGTQSGQVTVVSNSTTGGTSVVTLSGTGTAGAHEVDLTWNAPINSPSPVTGYNVYRSGSSGTFGLVNSSPVTAMAYVDTGVASGTTYNYIVKSLAANGAESGPSNQIAVTVP